MVVQAEKFLFETVFGADGEVVDPSTRDGVKKSFTPDEVEEIKQAAYSEGLSGLEAQCAQQNAQMIGQISESLVKIASVVQQDLQTIRQQAAEIALVTGQKISGTLMSREPEAEIVSLIDRCLRCLPSEPHIVVRVNEAIAGTVRTAIDPMISRSGFEGKVMVLGEVDLAQSDCEIEWPDGGLTRDTDAIAKSIEDLVAQHLNPAQQEQGDLFDL